MDMSHQLYTTISSGRYGSINIWHKDIGLEESRILFALKVTSGILVKGLQDRTLIFYDRGEAYGQDDPAEEMYGVEKMNAILKYWNLVFSEFNHNKDHSYTPLPNKNIDTGMGLERMASVSQNVRTNYETDFVSMPIMNEIEKVSGKQYLVNNEQDVAFKVIADHIRTIAFAISDGALPANEGRGYVLRRLLRRAVRF
ncbi:alanine--tRNA ligase-related protein [Staphylococcus aureus]